MGGSVPWVRRLVPTAALVALVLAAAACGDDGEPAATEPAREFAPVDIARPLNGDRVQGRERDEHLVGATVVEGTAEPGAELQVTGSCDEAGCTKPVTADGTGRFRVRLTLAAPAEKAGASIVAEYATDAAFDSDRVTVLLLPPSGADAPADQEDEPRRRKRKSRDDDRADATPPPAAEPSTPEDVPAPDEPATPAPSTGGRGSGRLVMVGDSLAQGTEPYLADMLDGWTVRTDARRGRPLAEGMRIIDGTSLGADDVLAVSLFTNDVPGNQPALEKAVRRSTQQAGCVVWATIVRPPVGGRSYGAVNAALARLDDELGDRMVLVPWAATAAANPGYMAADGVHATPAGYRARAQLYANAARSC